MRHRSGYSAGNLTRTLRRQAMTFLNDRPQVECREKYYLTKGCSTPLSTAQERLVLLRSLKRFHFFRQCVLAELRQMNYHRRLDPGFDRSKGSLPFDQ